MVKNNSLLRRFIFVVAGALMSVSVSFAVAQTTSIHNPAEVEAKVRAAFQDAPIMVDVARCESKFRQFTDAGNVLYGGYNNAMVGIFQIYASVHLNDARMLGYDINTVDGNIGYARHLYNRQKTDPWISSFPCWNGSASAPQNQTSIVTLQSDLSFGVVNEEVRVLQRLLNEKGFRVAESGPGSPGSETNIFGSLTRAALRTFQCAKNIACNGDEHSTGYGFVNSATRAALLGFATTPSTVSAPTTVSVPQSSDSPEIAALKAQIAVLMAKVLELQKQIELLRISS